MKKQNMQMVIVKICAAIPSTILIFKRNNTLGCVIMQKTICPKAKKNVDVMMSCQLRTELC